MQTTGTDFPMTCTEEQLERLGAKLNVPRNEGEALDAWRVRVAQARPGAVLGAPPRNTLGGMILGGG